MSNEEPFLPEAMRQLERSLKGGDWHLRAVEWETKAPGARFFEASYHHPALGMVTLRWVPADSLTDADRHCCFYENSAKSAA